jgi:hypothetical protein
MNNKRPMLRDPTALLVLRVWIEHGSTLPLRAYIRETIDVSVGFERTSTLTDVEAAVDAVRVWLEALLEDDAVLSEQPETPGGGAVQPSVFPSAGQTLVGGAGEPPVRRTGDDRGSPGIGSHCSVS